MSRFSLTAISTSIVLGSFAAALPRFIPMASAAPTTLLSDNFGTGSSVDNIPSWEEEGPDGDSSTRAQNAGGGEDSASPDGGRFAKIGEDEWICRTVSTSGYDSLLLSYYWRGDNDAESSDLGVVEYKTSGNCTDASGWSSLQNHDMNVDNTWSTQSAFSLPAGLNNGSFLLRFRTSSSASDEYFRVDAVVVTGEAILTTLTVNKVVVNDNTGTKVIADFPLFIDATPVTSGDVNTVSPGSYVVSETPDAGYAATFSGDCDAGGNVTLALGDAKTCTITNDDIPVSVCGNTTVESGEQCDDGNTVDGDLCSSTCQTQAAACVSSDSDLVGYWRFDEGSGPDATDSTATDNHGTLQNGAAFTASVPGLSFPNYNAMSFDGSNDVVSVSPDTDLGFAASDDFSVAAWVNPTAFGGYQTIAHKMDDTGGAKTGYLFTLANGVPEVWLISDYGAGNYLVATSSATLSTGSFQHVAFSYDGSSDASGVSIYVNGADVTTTPSVNALTGNLTHGQPFEIGARSAGGLQPFAGSIDDLRVYNRVLTEDEVDDLVGGACEAVPLPPASVCGNSVIEGAEACDDGNTTDGDGCSMACVIEPAFVCSGSPSSCVPTCNGTPATVYVKNGLIVSTVAADNGDPFTGSLRGGLLTSDVIVGTSGNDEIDPRGGNDLVCAGAGHDEVVGDLTGSDDIFGEDGNDSLLGGFGSDDLDGGPGVDYCFSVAGGTDSQVNCEATGALNGLIVIQKDAQPDDAQDFTFTGLGGFTLDDDADGTLSNEFYSAQFAGIGGNNFTISEDAVTGWELTGLTCHDPGGSTTTDIPTATAVVDLDAGEVITCTFTNTQLVAVCGNNAIELGEQCDDGGTVDGDGCSAACQTQPLACVSTDTDLMAYWKFDEASGTLADDSSGNNNDATLVNGVTPSSTVAPVSFYNPNSAQFTGASSQYFSAPDSASLDLSTAATISFWFNRNTGEAVNISKWDAGTNQRSYVLQIHTDDRIYWNLSGDGIAHTYFMSDNTYTGTGWHHILATYDGSSMGVYLDGTPVSGTVVGTVPASIFNSNQPVSNTYNGGNFNTGLIDDVRIYDRAFTAGELDDLFAGDCDAVPSVVVPVCGNNVIESGEQCDDGGTVDGDGCSATCQTQPLACVSTDADLVAHWKLDETASATTADDSTTPNNQGAVNGATSGVAGAALGYYNAGAFDFDGTDTVSTPGADFAFGTQEFSVNVFTKTTTGDRGVLGHFNNDGSYGGWGLYFYGSNRANFFGYGDMGTNDASQPAPTILDGNWHMVTGVYKRSGNDLTIETYVDGSLIGSNTSTVGDIAIDTDMLLGTYTFQPNFIGQMDDVRIYDRALTGSEITDLFGGSCDVTPPVVTTACTPTDSNLVAYWPFSEGVGTTTSDETSFDNQGVLSGPTWTAGSPSQIGFTNPFFLSFDGSNDLVSVSDKTDLNISGPFSISAWARSTGNSNYGFIAGTTDSGDMNGYYTTINQSNGFPVTYSLQSSTYQSADQTPNILNDNTWHHIVGTYDGTNLITYVDGVAGPSVPASAPLTNGNPFQIGASIYPGRFFTGDIDDVRVYDVALNGSQVSNLFAGACDAGVSVPGPVDTDSDTIVDGIDNCQFTPNLDQINTDGDGEGDACDADDDNDGHNDGVDNCPLDANSGQEDDDTDGIGNVCDSSPSVTTTFSGFSAPESNLGNGSSRGEKTNILGGVIKFLAGIILGNGNPTNAPRGAFGGVAPGAFGGSSDVPLTEDEIRMICSTKKALPKDVNATLLEAIAKSIGDVMNRETDFVLEALNDETLCGSPQAKAGSKVSTAVIPFRVSEDGYPLSKNPTWNVCITGKVKPWDIRNNPDKDEDGNPRDCSYYHTGSLWKHPDLMIYFTWNKKTKAITLPGGYVVKQEQKLSLK